jgi:hypothetical protein
VTRDGQPVVLDGKVEASLEIAEAIVSVTGSNTAVIVIAALPKKSSSLRAPLEKTEQRGGTRLVVAVCSDS